MRFHVGQKVVCVDDTNTTTIKKDSIYTVVALDCCDECMSIDVTSKEHGCNKWFRIRFRPIVERKTETGMAILRKVADDASTRRNLVVSLHD